MLDTGQVVEDSVLRVYRLAPGLPLLHSLVPSLPPTAVVSSLHYDGERAALYWSTDLGPDTDYWHLGLPLYTGLETPGGSVVVTNIFLPTCHTSALHRRHPVTVSVAARGDRVTVLDLASRAVTSRTFPWKSFRAVAVQEGLLALRESTLDNLVTG